MSRARKLPYRGKREATRGRSCGNHGGCPWCEGNRLHNDTKRRTASDDMLRAYREAANDPVFVAQMAELCP